MVSRAPIRGMSIAAGSTKCNGLLPRRPVWTALALVSGSAARTFSPDTTIAAVVPDEIASPYDAVVSRWTRTTTVVNRP
jgi:hypothetical protein